MSQDVREFLYTNMRTQRRYETDDDVGPAPLRFDAQKDDRVLLLLGQLGERLIRSERERLEMKETVGRYSDLITALENKVDRQAAAEEELRERQEKIEQEYTASMQKMQKAVLLAERIEEAINQQNRLARRIEQITQDKARMLRKLERIEEAVVETQTALNTKSLVMVGEQTRAVNAPSARMSRPANDQDESLWQSTTMRRLASTVAVFALIAGLSWGVYQAIPQSRFASVETAPVAAENLLAEPPYMPANTPDVRAQVPEPSLYNTTPDTSDVARTVENLIAPETSPAPAPAAALPDIIQKQAETIASPTVNVLGKSDDELVAMLNDDPNALASALNNITPGAAAMPGTIAPEPPAVEKTVTPVAVPTPPPAAQAAENDSSVNDFLRAQSDSRPLSQRIQPDASLPAALKPVEEKAFEGVPEAQHDLAALYTAGQGGVKTNFARAAQWFEEAALNNIPNARYNLGVLYHQGLGVKQDTAQAINWYKAAAAQNHPEAQYNLGIAYIEGVGTEYNPQKAAANFESAARSGILEASYNLGLIYENGLLGTPQVEDAIYWYNRAAEQGSPEGKAALNQLAKNMGYSESRIKDIYNKRKASLDGAPVRSQAASTAPAVMTPVSAPVAAAPRAVSAQDGIPVLPLDGDISAPDESELAPAPASQRGAARNSIRDASVIAQIQEQLMNYGLYPGPADGIYNDVMADAIRSYQKSNALDSDGRASEALLVHMLSQEMDSAE